MRIKEMKSNQSRTKAAKNYLPRRGLRYLSYTGHFISTTIEASVLGYLSYYLTDSVYMSVGMAATIFAASRVFDGVSDVIAGYIIDHTHTKLGKARPYMLFHAFMWIAVIMLFSVPNFSTAGKFVYVFLCYNLTETVSKTMVGTAFPVLFKLGYTADEQLEVTAIGGLAGSLMSAPVSILMPFMIDRFGTTPGGWRLIAVVMAIPAVLFGLTSLFFVPEVNDTADSRKERENVSIAESVKLLFSNKYVFMLLLARVSIAIVTAGGMTTYYFQYIVGNISAASVTGIVMLPCLLLMPFLPALARKFGIRNSVIGGLLLGIVSTLIPYLAPTNVLLVGISKMLCAVAIIPFAMFVSLIIIQCMKYTEWKSGKQADGVIASIGNVGEKVGLALGSLITGAMLGMAHYNGSLEVQVSSTNEMIKFLFLGLPAIMYLIAALALWKYDLEKKLPQIEQDLLHRAHSGENEVEAMPE